MISKTLALILVLVSIGCAGTAPTAKPQPAAIVRALAPTSTPSAESSAETIAWQQARRALAVYLQGGGEGEAIYNLFARAAVLELQDGLGATDTLPVSRLMDALQKSAQDLKFSADLMPQVIVIPLGQTASARTEIVCFSFVGMQGMPIVMLSRQGADLKPFAADVLGSFGTDGKRWAWLQALKATDLTGDGVNELISSYSHPDGSNSRQELEILRWDVQANTFKHIFHGFLVNWAGDSTYTFVNGEHGKGLQLSYASFGAFSAKMVDHLRVTEQWSYDATADGMVRHERTMEAPRTVRQQLNAAETLFRNSELPEALDAFELAATNSALTVENFENAAPVPRAFARFREGQILALLGRESEARTHFAQAAQAGGSLARLVHAYLANYQGQDSALRAWAMLPGEINLDAELYGENGASNLEFPALASEILFQGGVVAAYLNAHPPTNETLLRTLLGVTGLGFPLGETRVFDWDGDGQDEALVTVRYGIGAQARDTLWLIYQRQGQWRAREIFDNDNVRSIQLLDPLPLTSRRGAGLGIAWMTERHEQRWAQDGVRLQQLDLQTLQPLPTEENQYEVGWLPEQIEF